MEPVRKRTWRILAARAKASRTQRGDPRTRLRQAIAEAQLQHRRLREHAASVVATEKQAAVRVERARSETRQLDKVVRTTLRRAEQAERAGRAAAAAELNRAAETAAEQLVAAESGLADLEARHQRAAQASDAARAAVRESAAVLDQVLAEREELLGRLDEAAMLARLDEARRMPSLDALRADVDERYARAAGTAEVGAASFERRMLAAEHEARAIEARRRIDRIREDLALNAGDALSTPDDDSRG
jgi:phage shock protein A